MGLSINKLGAMDCLSDEFSTTDARTYSRKAYRKKVRGLFGQTGKENKLELECQFPARDQRFWKTYLYSNEEVENEMDLTGKTEDLKSLQREREQSKENLKQRLQNEKFEEWCVGKSKKVVRKKQNQLKREGKDNPYESESTDSEIEKKVEKWYRIHERDYCLTEIKKYYETDSLMSFKRYRNLKTK